MERTSGSTSSTDDATRRPVPVARVVGAHGLRGRLRVALLVEDAAVLRALPVVALDGPGGGRRFAVVGCEPGRSGEARLELEGVRRREQAEALRGAEVLADAAELPAPAAGEVYGFELVGCRLEGEDGAPVGIVRGIWRTGADVLVVEAPGGGERLVPAALVRRVDAAARRAVAEIPPGLLEAEPR